ncbi:efflux RND transporter periplasmic adaptor subunit [Roseococcus sp.]|uniref:efflux RND transporter periplasmic adaptor subunit n=1 Tax=Roseococcus sp. TaxID=2109646 RepID=UPI003BA8ACE2
MFPLEPAAAADPAAVPVRVASVRNADVPVTLECIGTVQAFTSVTIRAQVDGILQQVAFTEGQAVRAGDVLARIDPRPFQAALDQAQAKRDQDQAQLENARLNLQRFQGVGDFASRQQVATQQAMVSQLEAQVRGDEAAIENARTQLGYATITAPMDGITGIRLVDQGNLLRATDATGIVVLNQIRPISVTFTLPAEALPDIRQAMAAEPLGVTVLERQGQRTLGTGTLALVDNQIDQATGTIRLKATLPNTDSALWPGQFVNVQLLLRTDRGVPTLPGTAIQRGPDGNWVYILQADGTVVVQAVTVNRFADGRAVIAPGLDPAARVVTSGQFRLSPGARAEVATP